MRVASRKTAPRATNDDFAGFEAIRPCVHVRHITPVAPLRRRPVRATGACDWCVRLVRPYSGWVDSRSRTSSGDVEGEASP